MKSADDAHKATLTALFQRTIAADPFPLSPRVRELRAILGKLTTMIVLLSALLTTTTIVLLTTTITTLAIRPTMPACGLAQRCLYPPRFGPPHETPLPRS